jgi:hypothetical protein
MNGFKFQPGDIVVYEIEGYGVLKPLVRWLLGSKWGHVGIFYDYTKRGLPLTVESIGRGVMISSLLSYQNRSSKVMRWSGDEAEEVGLKVAKAAERIADNPGSWYGYLDIPRYMLPRLIWYKLTKRRFGFGYRKNSHFICSELVAQSFRNAGFPLFKGDFIPLPGDFVNSPRLQEVWSGKLKSKPA